MPKPTIHRAAMAAVALASVTSACGGDDASSPTTVASVEAPTFDPTTTGPTTSTSVVTTTADPQSTRPYEYDMVALALSDGTRTTSGANGAVQPSRSLPTTLYLPATADPAPLIVFSHGFGASPAKFERLLAAWAEAGYAVAAIAFPLTSDLIDSSERIVGDVANQPADVVFVLDQLLAGEYASRFDAGRIAAAGLSLGGLTTYLAAVDRSTRDPRFTAAVVMAAVPPGASFAPHPMPVMVMHGQFDPVVPVSTSDATFATLTGPTYEVVMLGGFHAEPFEDQEENAAFPDRERFHPVVDATTIAFWDTYLMGEAEAGPTIAEAGDRSGITTFASRPA